MTGLHCEPCVCSEYAGTPGPLHTPALPAERTSALNFQLAVPATDEKWRFSLLRNDWSPRPAYAALAAMAKS